ncbi:NUDIX hydrolase [Streptomyces sp. NPDC001999]
MTITAQHIRTVLDGYLGQYPGDKTELAGALEALDAGADLTSRKEFLPGHATAGVVLLDGAGNVLYIRHLALERWLLPGGHLEPEDDTLRGAALRELAEETGIAAGAVAPVGEGPIHIDVHRIPASDAKGEPAHWHVDFRFVFCLAAGGEVRLRLQEEEVSGCAWRPAGSVADPVLRRRIVGLLA